MGVKGLWSMLKDAAEEETPYNKVVAVDISIWIHYFKDLNETDMVYFFSKRIIKLLYHNIKPVFVFDGSPNEAKKRVLEERKKINNNKLINDIIHNRKCKKCNKSVRVCRHGGMLNDKIRGEEEEVVIKNLKAYDKRWGVEVSERHNDDKGVRKYKEPKVVIDELKIKEIVESTKLSKTKKLKMLLKMREKRKEHLGYDESSLMTFSESQVTNIKRRNLISFYIRKLEKETSSVIQSDSLKQFRFIKGEERYARDDVEIHNKAKIEDTVDPITSSLNQLNAKDELDRLFELCATRLEAKCRKTDQTACDKDVSSGENESSEDEEGYAKVENLKRDGFKQGFIAQESIGMAFDDDLEEFHKPSTFEDTEVKINKVQEGDETYDFNTTQTNVRKLLDVFNVPSIIPPGEADSQCGYLSKEKIVDGVITEDNDVLLYGGTVYRNFFRKNKPIEKFSPQNIEDKCNLDQSDLIKISYVLGSDYTIGILGIGPKKVVDYLKDNELDEFEFKKYSSIYSAPKVDKSFRPVFKALDCKRIIKYWGYKGLNTERLNELMFYLKGIS